MLNVWQNLKNLQEERNLLVKENEAIVRAVNNYKEVQQSSRIFLNKEMKWNERRIAEIDEEITKYDKNNSDLGSDAQGDTKMV